jgi:hypothetical protein
VRTIVESSTAKDAGEHTLTCNNQLSSFFVFSEVDLTFLGFH